MSKTLYTVSHWRSVKEAPDHYIVLDKAAFEALARPGQCGTTDVQIGRALDLGYIKPRIFREKPVSGGGPEPADSATRL